MSSLLFARITFESKLQHFSENMGKYGKNKYYLDKFLEIINSDTNINKNLNKAGKHKLLKNHSWRFGCVKSGDNYIYAKLGKTKEYNITHFDKNKKDFINESTDNSLVIRFLIDLNSKVFVYQHKRDVGNKAPINLIESLFNSYFDNKEQITIKTITDKQQIVSMMKKLTKLESIELNVYRTNPNSTHGSDKMDDFLKKGNIKKILIKAQSDEMGINLNNIDLLNSGFHLAEEGYGTGKARGKIDNKDKTINIGNVPIREDDDLLDDDNINIKILLKQITKVLNKLK